MPGRGRYPHHSDVKEVMDNVGGWAHDWDDVLWYVDGPAVYDADIAKREVPQLNTFFHDAQDKQLPFTTDYRQVWREVTGEDPSYLPPQKGIKSHGVNPRHLADELQGEVRYPAGKDAVVNAARRRHASEREIEVLQEIEDKQYENVWMVIEEVGDRTWDYD